MTDSADILPDFVRGVVSDEDRVSVLHDLDVLDSAPDEDFDRIAVMASRIFGVPYAQVSLISADKQWFRACFGIVGISETSVETSFCAHTIASPEDAAMVVLDTLEDPRFRDNPFVTDEPNIRFYAGVPMVVRGARIGSVCVQDNKPWTEVPERWMDQLRDLAELAGRLLELKDESRHRARTAAALLREEWRHALTLEAGQVGSWVWNIAEDDITCNDTFRRMYGLPGTGRITAETVLEATYPDDRNVVREALSRSLKGDVDYEVEARSGPELRWLAMRGRVYQRDSHGRAQVMMGVSVDTTANRKAAEQTHMLLRELNHRVKNTLAMIQSVARQTLRRNPEPKAFLDAFTGRLQTISEAHLLLADRDWAWVQLHEILQAQLGQDFLSASGQIRGSGEDISLPADHALGLGLVLHELTTNARRHGALSTSGGRLMLSWRLEEAPKRGVRLFWTESGGPPVTMPNGPGLGVKLIERSLAKVLDSSVRLDMRPDGVQAEIWLPLPGAQG